MWLPDVADELLPTDHIVLVLPDGKRIERSVTDLARIARTSPDHFVERLMSAIRAGIIEPSETDELTYYVDAGFVASLGSDESRETFEDDLARERVRRRRANSLRLDRGIGAA